MSEDTISLEEAWHRVQAVRSMEEAVDGRFTILAERLRSSFELSKVEREFIAGIFDGSSKYASVVCDGKVVNKRNRAVEWRIIDIVMREMHLNGRTKMQAIREAQVENSCSESTVRRALKSFKEGMPEDLPEFEP